MIDDKVATPLLNLTVLGLCLNGMIDSGRHEGITKDQIREEIESGTIFKYLERFDQIARWGLGGLTDEDKRRLLGEWQSMSNAIDSEGKLLVATNGICLLLAYVIAGVQMRIALDEPWPGPEPFLERLGLPFLM